MPETLDKAREAAKDLEHDKEYASAHYDQHEKEWREKLESPPAMPTHQR